MGKTYKTLTESDVNHFVEKGHVILKGCFSRELAEECGERSVLSGSVMSQTIRRLGSNLAFTYLP